MILKETAKEIVQKNNQIGMTMFKEFRMKDYQKIFEMDATRKQAERKTKRSVDIRNKKTNERIATEL